MTQQDHLTIKVLLVNFYTVLLFTNKYLSRGQFLTRYICATASESQPEGARPGYWNYATKCMYLSVFSFCTNATKSLSSLLIN